MNLVFRILLTVNATVWVIVVYCIKEELTILPITPFYFSITLLLIPVILSFVTIWLTMFLGKDNIKNCAKIEEADSSFLPVYLGYFFVGLSIDKIQPLVFVYLIIFIFTFVAQTQYFNPMYLLLGYRFYKIETTEGTRVFLITKKALRKSIGVEFSDLRRINDTTYLDMGEI